jgi:hypothetical protein
MAGTSPAMAMWGYDDVAAMTPSEVIRGHGARTVGLVAPRTATYLREMPKLSTLGIIALVVALLVILLAAGWFAAQAWISVEGPPMPANGYIAMTLGIVFSLVIGFGLMGLVFYSSRHGYDEPHRADEERD